MAEAARILEYEDAYFYGSAVPKREVYDEPAPEQVEIPALDERVRQRERAKAEEMSRSLPSVSLFAIFGTILVGALMTFMILAQISFNEIAGETTRLNAQMSELTDKQRKLGITFESVIDMKEVERYARDELGMSNPDADQVAVISSIPSDKAEIMETGEEGMLKGLGSFISSLLEYFK